MSIAIAVPAAAVMCRPVLRAVPGRRFEPTVERELLPSVLGVAAALRMPAEHVMVVSPECSLPTGIPDVLVLMADRAALTRRMNAGVEALTSSPEVQLLAACGVSRSSRLERLAAAGGVSQERARTIMRSLVKRGAAFGDPQRGWIRNPDLLPIGRVIAIEAKIGDWRSGLDQCLTYLTHADGALLVARISLAVRERAKESARRDGVGLVIDDTWIARPVLVRHGLARRLRTSEHLLAHLDLSHLAY